ncbi:MAG TPA: hypothetical protein VGK67_19590 [Myxococcales bacterium]
MSGRDRKIAWAVVALACLLACVPLGRMARTRLRAMKFDPASGQTPPEAGFLTGTMEFTLPPAAWDAGTGSLVAHGGRTLILTAVHLLGPAGGYGRQLTGTEVAQVTHAAFTDQLTGKTYESTKPLVIPGVAPMGGGLDGAAHDLAAFVVDGPAMGWTLSDAVAPVGAKLQVAFGKDVHEVEVVESSPTHLLYVGNVPGPGSSGALVLDRDRRVVGLHTGFCRWKGEPCGQANPSVSILSDLQTASDAEAAR